MKNLDKAIHILGQAGTARYSFPTEDGVKRLVGKIRGFDRNGVWYDQEDGEPWVIDGKDILAQILEQMREVTKSDVGDEDTEVEVNISRVWDFLSSSGYVDMGYTEEQAAEDMQADPLGILGSIQHEYEIRVDPYSYAREVEQEPLEEEQDAESEGAFVNEIPSGD